MVDMIPPDFLIAFSTLFCELLRLRFSINDDIFRSITLGGLRALFAFLTLVAVLVLVCRLITDTYCMLSRYSAIRITGLPSFFKSGRVV